MHACYPINLKGEIWKAIDSAIGESSRRIIATGINSLRNGYEANEVLNEVHNLYTNIHTFGLIGDNITNIQQDHFSKHISANTFYVLIRDIVHNVCFYTL